MLEKWSRCRKQRSTLEDLVAPGAAAGCTESATDLPGSAET